jgi:hypothetical protein
MRGQFRAQDSSISQRHPRALLGSAGGIEENASSVIAKRLRIALHGDGHLDVNALTSRLMLALLGVAFLVLLFWEPR